MTWRESRPAFRRLSRGSRITSGPSPRNSRTRSSSQSRSFAFPSPDETAHDWACKLGRIGSMMLFMVTNTDLKSAGDVAGRGERQSRRGYRVRDGKENGAVRVASIRRREGTFRLDEQDVPHPGG